MNPEKIKLTAADDKLPVGNLFLLFCNIMLDISCKLSVACRRFKRNKATDLVSLKNELSSAANLRKHFKG